MKKKIVLLMFMSLFVFVLAGCDFGNKTTTTTTTSATTSQTTSNTGTTTTTTTNTTTGTTTTTTSATTTTTSQVVFDRQDLIDYLVASKDYTPEASEIETEITMYMNVLGYDTEEELYQMLMNVDMLMTGLMDVDTLLGFQTWYAGAKSLGFDESMMTTTAVNAITLLLAQASQIDPDDVLAEIASLEAAIVALDGDIAAAYVEAALVRDDVVAYASQFLVNPQLVNLYDLMILDNQAQNDYYETYYELSDSDKGFDWEVYNTLENYLDEYYYYTYVETDSFDPQSYMDSFTTLLATIGGDVHDTYVTILNSYMAWQNGYYLNTMPLEESLYTVIDSDTMLATSVIHEFYYDYQYILWDIEYYQWDIDDLNYEIEDMRSELMMLDLAERFDTYFSTTEGLATTLGMVAMIYDTIDYIATNVSQTSFDFIMGLMSGESIPDPETLTALEIVALISQVKTLLNLVGDSFSEADAQNMIQFSKDISGMFVMTLGLDPTEEAAMITTINTEIETYFTMVGDVVEELLSFMDSISVAKVNAIMDFVDLMNSETATQYETAIAVATVIDVVLGDDSIDLTLLANYAIDGLFDATSMFDPDETAKDALKLTVSEGITDILAQAAVISGYDPSNLTTDQMTAVQDFMATVQTLMETIGNNVPQEPTN